MKDALTKVLCRCKARRTAIEHHDQNRRMNRTKVSMGMKPKPGRDAPQEHNTQKHGRPADQAEEPAQLTPSLRSAAPGASSSWAKRCSQQASTSPAASEASGPRRDPPAMAAMTPSWL